MHPQTSPHSALCVVFVSDRHSKQGNDAVAHQLVDGATKGGDIGNEAFEAHIDQALHLLWVKILRERRETHEIGEQHGDDTPLFRC